MSLKVSIASNGVSTIVLSLTLKDVFNIIGNPLSFSNSINKCIKTQCDCWSYEERKTLWIHSFRGKYVKRIGDTYWLHSETGFCEVYSPYCRGCSNGYWSLAKKIHTLSLHNCIHRDNSVSIKGINQDHIFEDSNRLKQLLQLMK